MGTPGNSAVTTQLQATVVKTFTFFGPKRLKNHTLWDDRSLQVYHFYMGVPFAPTPLEEERMVTQWRDGKHVT